MNDKHDSDHGPIYGFYDWDIIHTYTRADALNDGELVAGDPQLLTQAGFLWPLAYTRSVFATCIDWDDTDDHRTPEGTGQSRIGREWDVLTMLYRAISARKASGTAEGHTLTFTVAAIPRTGGTRPIPVTLYAAFGPGDNGEPVITVVSDLSEL
jgi:hypothetical protein